jgi:hypothetical protein
MRRSHLGGGRLAATGAGPGGFLVCQRLGWIVIASMETDKCFVDVIWLKLLQPELYLKE